MTPEDEREFQRLVSAHSAQRSGQGEPQRLEIEAEVQLRGVFLRLKDNDPDTKRARSVQLHLPAGALLLLLKAVIARQEERLNAIR